jgi:DNA-binding protein H-NS
MRKPRDYDSELKALDEKATRLKERKVQQLGELVVACGTDALSPEHLAGALLGIAETKDAATKEGWRKRGAAFFQRSPRKSAGNPSNKPEGTLPL